MNNKHLTMLADYLDALPEDYEHFDMEDIYTDKTSGFDGSPYPSLIKEIGLHCGTVACAIGHTPFVDKMPQPELGEDWYKYWERIYCLDHDEEEEWCFSAEWRFKDNTPRGAAARIRQLVSDGLPDDWYEQIHCPDHPLSYTVHTSPTEKDSD